MSYKIIFSLIATFIAVFSYIPYLIDIKRGKTKPHAYTWLIFGILGLIAGFAQLVDGGGVGSLVALVTGIMSMGICFYALKQKAVRATRGDKLCLTAALAAIPIWLLTKNPLFSVVIISFIDVIGFWPTIRKSFDAPHQETLSTNVLSAIKHYLTIAAQERYTVVTVLYPTTLAITTTYFVIILIGGRARLVRHPRR